MLSSVRRGWSYCSCPWNLVQVVVCQESVFLQNISVAFTVDLFSLKAHFASVLCFKGFLPSLTDGCWTEISSPSDFSEIPCVKQTEVFLLLYSEKILPCADRSGCFKMTMVALLVFRHGSPSVEAVT